MSALVRPGQVLVDWQAYLLQAHDHVTLARDVHVPQAGVKLALLEPQDWPAKQQLQEAAGQGRNI